MSYSEQYNPVISPDFDFTSFLREQLLPQCDSQDQEEEEEEEEFTITDEQTAIFLRNVAIESYWLTLCYKFGVPDSIKDEKFFWE